MVEGTVTEWKGAKECETRSIISLFPSTSVLHVLEENGRQSNLVILRGQCEEGFKLRQYLVRKEGKEEAREGGKGYWREGEREQGGMNGGRGRGSMKGPHIIM